MSCMTNIINVVWIGYLLEGFDPDTLQLGKPNVSEENFILGNVGWFVARILSPQFFTLLICSGLFLCDV